MGSQVPFLVTGALLAFAGNSLLCRGALAETGIDPWTFTVARVISGALALSLLLLARGRPVGRRGEAGWASAVALLGYAACFSLAYRRIDTGVGALVLFGSVQVTMIGAGLLRDERSTSREWLGLLAALGGLALITLPGKAAPDLAGALSMALAGIAWGIFSLRGRSMKDALGATTESFVRAGVLVIPIAFFGWVTAPAPTATLRGLLLAVVSGAVTSGLGYALWYRALPFLSRHHAAILQLVVPILAALGGVWWLGESLHRRLVLGGTLVLGGVAIALTRPVRRGA